MLCIIYRLHYYITYDSISQKRNSAYLKTGKISDDIGCNDNNLRNSMIRKKLMLEYGKISNVDIISLVSFCVRWYVSFVSSLNTVLQLGPMQPYFHIWNFFDSLERRVSHDIESWDVTPRTKKNAITNFMHFQIFCLLNFQPL